MFFRFRSSRIKRATNVITTVNFSRSAKEGSTMFRRIIKCTNRLSTISSQVLRRPFRRFIISQLFPYVGSSLRRGIYFFGLIPRRIMILQRFRFQRIVLNSSLHAGGVRSYGRPTATKKFLIHSPFAIRFI